MNIGNTIKKIRLENGIKQNFIAEKAGLSKEHLSNIEAGKRMPTLDSLDKICSALKISLPRLLILASDTMKDKFSDEEWADLMEILSLADEI